MGQIPARTWGKVFVTIGGSVEEYCSATAVNSDNQSVVWTAGHCVYTEPGEGPRHWLNSRWVFVPGYVNGRAPYGIWRARALYTTQQWLRHGNDAFDIGAAVVEPLNGRTLVDAVGGEGIYFNQPRGYRYLSGGYPVDPPFNGRWLFACDSPVAHLDREEVPATTGIGCDLTGGSSGGGWLIGVAGRSGFGYILGVTSYSIDGERNVLYSPYFGSVAGDLYRYVETQ